MEQDLELAARGKPTQVQRVPGGALGVPRQKVESTCRYTSNERYNFAKLAGPSSKWVSRDFTATNKAEHLPPLPSLAWLSSGPMTLKLQKNSRQPRVLPDFDPAGLVLVEPLAVHINPLIILINEHLTLEVAGLEVLCQHAHGFDLRAPSTQELLCEGPCHCERLHPGAISGQWKFANLQGNISPKVSKFNGVIQKVHTYPERFRMSRTHLNFQKWLDLGAQALGENGSNPKIQYHL